MNRISFSYDEENDVAYIFLGKPRRTINIDVDQNITMRLDPKTREVVGSTITNWSIVWPEINKKMKEKFAKEYLASIHSTVHIFKEQPSLIGVGV